MLGKYQIVRQLGQGGMGAVFEAVHTGIGKAVALKTMNPALASDPRSEERFLREAEAASRLEHPHVVGVTDFGSDAGVIYLVMELLRGEDLANLIARAPAGLETAFVADVMLATCAGVFAAHESGLVHRDLKPQNIFLSQTALGELLPKVLDFGISKMVNRADGHSLTHSGSVMGTTHYLSPEQVQGAPLDGRSDEYALGVILYECVTGRRPHDGETLYAIMRSISEGRFAPPRALRPDLSPQFEAVILRAMAIRADDRFPSVHALGRALLGLASQKGRVVWTDYYSRQMELAAARQPGPIAPAVNANTAWRPFAPPAAPTVFSARSTPSDVSPVSVIRTNQLLRRRTARWGRVLLGMMALGAAGAAYLNFGPARSLIESAKHNAGTQAPAEKAQAAPAAAGRPRPATTTRAPAPPAREQAVPVAPPAPPAAPPATTTRTAPPPAERPAEVDPTDLPPAARKATAAKPITTRPELRTRPAVPSPPAARPKRPAVRTVVPRDPPPRRQPATDDLLLPPSRPMRSPGGAPILD
jgi:serine/threonine-protein kinase